MPTRTTTRMLLVTALVGSACAKSNTSQIASPDPHAAPATTARSTATSEQPSHDLSEICAEAGEIAKAEARPRGAPVLVIPWARTTTTTGVLALAPKPYTIADLEALAKAQQYPELFAHLEDVPPSKRDARWEAVMVQAATEVMKDAASSDDLQSAWGGFATAEALLQRCPALAKEPAFMTARGTVGGKMLGSCFDHSYRGSECVDMATAFVAVDGTADAVKLEVAKVVRRGQNAHVAVPFFAAAFGQDNDGTVCADDDFVLAVSSGLALPTDYDGAKTARDLSGRCFGALRPKLEELLVEEQRNSLFRDNACAVFRGQGAL